MVSARSEPRRLVELSDQALYLYQDILLAAGQELSCHERASGTFDRPEDAWTRALEAELAECDLEDDLLEEGIDALLDLLPDEVSDREVRAFIDTRVTAVEFELLRRARRRCRRSRMTTRQVRRLFETYHRDAPERWGLALLLLERGAHLSYRPTGQQSSDGVAFVAPHFSVGCQRDRAGHATVRARRPRPRRRRERSGGARGRPSSGDSSPGEPGDLEPDLERGRA